MIVDNRISAVHLLFLVILAGLSGSFLLGDSVLPVLSGTSMGKFSVLFIFQMFTSKIVPDAAYQMNIKPTTANTEWQIWRHISGASCVHPVSWGIVTVLFFVCCRSISITSSRALQSIQLATTFK